MWAIFYEILSISQNNGMGLNNVMLSRKLQVENRYKICHVHPPLQKKNRKPPTTSPNTRPPIVKAQTLLTKTIPPNQPTIN